MSDKEVYQLLEETLSAVESIRSLYYVESKQEPDLQVDYTDDVKALVEMKKEVDIILTQMRTKREAKLQQMGAYLMKGDLYL